MVRINRLTWTNRSALARRRRLAAPCTAARAAIMAGIVLMSATGLTGFTGVMTGPAAVASVTAMPTAAPKTAAPPLVPVPRSGTAAGGTSGGRPRAARSGLSAWLFSLIGAVADAILVLLTAALVFVYLLLRRTPTDLHVRRSGGTSRSSRPGRRDSGAGQPDSAVAQQMTAEPAAPGRVAAKPRTRLLTGTFDRFSPRREPADQDKPPEEDGFAFLSEPTAETADEPASRAAGRGTPRPLSAQVALVPSSETPRPSSAPDDLVTPLEYRTRMAEVRQVLLGGDRIRVTLAEDGSPRPVTQLVAPNGQPYGHHLAWSGLPHEAPEDGIAFACLGSSDRGGLFLDLGQAPDTVAIDGDPQAVARLAESIAHQLCATSDSTRRTVVIIGDALPRPHPTTATWLASLDRLGAALAAYPSELTAIVFCRLGTTSDGQTLTGLIAGTRCRVVPVVLNGSLDEPWSITATPVAGASGTMQLVPTTAARARPGNLGHEDR